MFRSQSKTTLRVKGLPTSDELDKPGFQKCMEDMIEKEGVAPCEIELSLSEQEDHQVATVSFPTRARKTKMKRKALHRLRSRYQSSTKNLSVDDTFADMTVLQSPQDADIDICVIHGLNGNGFDTFAKKSDEPGLPCVMWPRDFLQHDREKLGQPRVMTYDYNSSLIDPHDQGNINDWATSLLKLLNRIRTPEMRGTRPIIFVGYSLGGLVARDVAIELYHERFTPTTYPCTALEDCGFLFLGTPFHGSSLMNYGSLSVALAAGFGLRLDLAQKFKTFSHELQKARRTWNNIQSMDGGRPLVCLCEKRDTRTFYLLKRRIVHQASASWMNCNAEEMPGRDHHTICTFSSTTEQGYDHIRWGLGDLRKQLMSPRRSNTTYEAPFDGSTQAADIPGGSIEQEQPVARANGHILSPEAPIQHARMGRDVVAHFVTLQQADPFVQMGLLKPIACFKYTRQARYLETDLHLIASLPGPHKTLAETKDPAITSATSELGDETYNGQRNSETPRHPGSATTSRAISPDLPSISSMIGMQNLDYSMGGAQAATNRVVRSAWQKQTILTIDGGGLRGYSALLMLQALMKEIEHVERAYLPAKDASFPRSESPQSIVSLASSGRTHSGSSTLSLTPPRRFSLTAPRRSRRRFEVVRTPSDQEKRQLYPCHYFDFVVGSSTGGLIAILLGRLRMSINDCLVYYAVLSATLYQQPSFPGQGLFARNRYSSRHIQKGFEDVIASHKRDYPDRVDDSTSLASPADLCKTAVVALEGKSRTPTLLRSYDHLPKRRARMGFPDRRQDDGGARKSGAAETMQIWEAARATTAAPSYFVDNSIRGTTFIDAGISVNNPSREAVWEVLDMHNDEHDSIECLVSLGCGGFKRDADGELPEVPKRGHGLVDRARRAAYESEEAHDATESLMKYIGKEYYRFNVDTGIWRIPLGDLESQSHDGYHHNKHLSPEARSSLERPLVRRHLARCAQQHVAHRHAREREDSDRWLRFANGTFYRCAEDSEQFKRSKDLERHLRADHTGWWNKQAPQDREAYMRQCEMEARLAGGPT